MLRQNHYYWLARGVDHRPVRPDQIRKSVGAENTFSNDLTELEAMKTSLQPIIDKVWRHCDQTGVRGRTVTLKVKYTDFHQITRSRTLAGIVEGRAALEAPRSIFCWLWFPSQTRFGFLESPCLA
jgi:DNA polymerase IV